MKPRAYVQSTIPSYLTAWPSRDLIRAAHQQVTREWWDRRDAFDLFVSQLALVECKAGDPAADRMAILAGLPLLEQADEVAALGRGLGAGSADPAEGRGRRGPHRDRRVG